MHSLRERLVTSSHLIIKNNQERNSSPNLIVVQINQQKCNETSIRVCEQCLEFVTLYTHALGEQAGALLEKWRVDKGPSFRARHSWLIRKEQSNEGETGISVNWICVIYVCRGRFWLHLAVVRGLMIKFDKQNEQCAVCRGALL